MPNASCSTSLLVKLGKLAAGCAHAASRLLSACSSLLSIKAHKQSLLRASFLVKPYFGHAKM
eukprot:9685123-Karenia_brevis.AAC.1